MRVFAGLTLEEIAVVENVSRATVSRDWKTARLLLLSQLQGPPGETEGGTPTSPMNDDRRSDDTSKTRWARVTELVDAALRHAEPAERSRFLHRACGDDQDLRRQIEHLL